MQVYDIDDVYTPMDGAKYDVDVDIDVKFEGRSFDGTHHIIIVFMDPAL